MVLHQIEKLSESFLQLASAFRVIINIVVTIQLYKFILTSETEL